MYSKTTIIALLVLVLTLALAACGGTISSEPEATPTERPLMSFDFEDVCLEGTQAKASAYNPDSGEVQKILVMNKSNSGNNNYNELYGVKFPVPWMVENDDYTQVALVACIERTGEEYLDVCEYDDDDSDDVYKLNVHNADYEMKIYTAQSGELLTTESFSEEVDECPMFHMFSELEEDYYPSPSDTSMQSLVAPFVDPGSN